MSVFLSLLWNINHQASTKLTFSVRISSVCVWGRSRSWFLSASNSEMFCLTSAAREKSWLRTVSSKISFNSFSFTRMFAICDSNNSKILSFNYIHCRVVFFKICILYVLRQLCFFFRNCKIPDLDVILPAFIVGRSCLNCCDWLPDFRHDLGQDWHQAWRVRLDFTQRLNDVLHQTVTDMVHDQHIMEKALYSFTESTISKTFKCKI